VAGAEQAIPGCRRETHGCRERAPAIAQTAGQRPRILTWIDMNVGLNFAPPTRKALIFVTVFVVIVTALNVVWTSPSSSTSGGTSVCFRHWGCRGVALESLLVAPGSDQGPRADRRGRRRFLWALVVTLSCPCRPTSI
jgi:hypothetical protein